MNSDKRNLSREMILESDVLFLSHTIAEKDRAIKQILANRDETVRNLCQEIAELQEKLRNIHKNLESKPYSEPIYGMTL